MDGVRLCRVCRSPFVAHIQDVYLQRQRRTAEQFYCLECESFFHTSGYTETEEQLRADLGWLLDHPGDHSSLIRALKAHFPAASSCYEIGCGAGSLLAALRKAGYEASGVEPNPFAVEHARRSHGIAVTQGFFAGGVRADLVLAVDVLEHVPDPRWFFSRIVSCVNPGGGIAVRVPTIERHQWRFLLDASVERPFSIEDPFCDASVHITNFSSKGLHGLASEFGSSHVETVGGVVLLRTGSPRDGYGFRRKAVSAWRTNQRKLPDKVDPKKLARHLRRSLAYLRDK
jgi:2-polyprenyl-3-methyl-5-hydroxy-6-metoxy-1,4-benzoquinol methylase